MNISENTDFRNPPMNEEEVHNIPEFKFNASSQPNNSDNKNCVICFEDFKTGDRSKLLECGHIFHADCLNKWLLEKSTCPLCMTSINT
jgi:hypothetical protein